MTHPHSTQPERKFFGGGRGPHRPSLDHIVLAWLGSLIALGLIGFITEAYDQTLLLACFGASCVLAFGYPKSPMSQPRNLLGGYLLAGLLGFASLWLFGAHWWSAALALATLVALMLYTRTGHPPAGANLLTIMTTQPHWSFLFDPTLAGVGIILLVALAINNLGKDRSYPTYWIG